MSLADYLTKNYLSDGKQPKRKEKGKKKHKTNESRTSIIADDSISPQKHPTQKHAQPTLGDKNQTHIVSAVNDSKRVPRETSGWRVVGTNEIITKPSSTEQRMASGALAGLQTGEEVSRQIQEKRQKEIEYMKSQSIESLGGNNDTVHRDSSGKKINISQIKNDEESRRKEEAIEKERRLKELNMGLIQKLELQEERRRLRSAAESGLNQYADSLKHNEALKRKELDDDPLLSFGPQKSRKNVSRTGRKLYNGGFPENRFGIVPGYRWDGVDRSNGFERSWFKKQVEKERVKTLSYTMQEDY